MRLAGPALVVVGGVSVGGSLEADNVNKIGVLLGRVGAVLVGLAWCPPGRGPGGGPALEDIKTVILLSCRTPAPACRSPARLRRRGHAARRGPALAVVVTWGCAGAAWWFRPGEGVVFLRGWCRRAGERGG